jgi:branched-chain amino acid transport system substrate-binding protein
MKAWKLLAAGALVVGGVNAALAADPVKIGFVTTLSGPPGYIGQDARDAFLLAVEQEGGKLGGVVVDVMVEDDQLKPGTAKQIVDRMIKRDKTKIITGTIFSNVQNAIAADVFNNNAFYISPNAGSSEFAGKGCHKNYFVASWQNDNLHEAAGEAANKAGAKNMFLIAANYQAGKDAITGFKRFYKGNVVGEVYTKLDQTDYAAELAQIRAAKPDAVYNFLPGGIGINFYKQYAQAGLSTQIPHIVSAAGADPTMLKAIGADAAVGIKFGTFWDASFDNPANKRFVADFEKKYNRAPTPYAAQGYDTARLIGSALKAVGGDMKKMDSFRKALEEAKFDSVRGKFQFAANHHPIQDWYMFEVVKAPGAPGFTNKSLGQIMTNHRDAYLPECKM